MLLSLNYATAVVAPAGCDGLYVQQELGAPTRRWIHSILTTKYYIIFYRIAIPEHPVRTATCLCKGLLHSLLFCYGT